MYECMCDCVFIYYYHPSIILAITDAGYSPGTHHNMPSKLQATNQLCHHTWGAGMCALHLSLSETIIKNVPNRIKIVDTPEELGR